jgi:hypothetical protein
VIRCWERRDPAGASARAAPARRGTANASVSCWVRRHGCWQRQRDDVPAAALMGIARAPAPSTHSGSRWDSGPWSRAARSALSTCSSGDAALLGSAAALWGWGVGGKRLSLASLATIAVVSSAWRVFGLIVGAHRRCIGPPFRSGRITSSVGRRRDRFRTNIRDPCGGISIRCPDMARRTWC